MANDASSKVPYLQAYGNIKKALDRLIQAPVPPKFTQDFLATTLQLSGGGARPTIKFLKRAGFLATDGTPTTLYNKFRNADLRGSAAAQGLRNAYSSLYAVNEYVHDADDKKLRGLIIQVTGLEESSKLIPSMVGSFKALREFADFSGDQFVAAPEGADAESEGPSVNGLGPPSAQGALQEFRLGYTINLNLPSTTDIAVFNAIFKSLREHLLK